MAKKPENISRRDFLKFTGLSLGSGAIGLTILSGSKKISPTLLRPPGAQLEEDFLATCIRCGQCVDACPYDTLKLADITDGAAFGTPYLVARETPCYLCQKYGEMRCIPACPTGALKPIAEKNEVKMGIAVIDEELCLGWNGVICRACWHACPFPDDAIELDSRGKVFIHAEACVGCGICDNVCLTEPSSITIIPTGDNPA